MEKLKLVATVVVLGCGAFWLLTSWQTAACPPRECTGAECDNNGRAIVAGHEPTICENESRGVRTVSGFMCCIANGRPGVFFPLGSECSLLYDLDLSGPFPDGAEITLSDYRILQNNFSIGWWG